MPKTPRKRALSMRALNSPHQSPGAVADQMMADNDDEAEKLAARQKKQAEIDLADAASPFKKTPREAGNPVATTQKLTDDAISDLYSNCIKLSTDNVRLPPLCILIVALR